MSITNESNLKLIIEEFMERLKKSLIENSAAEADQINGANFYRTVYELGRQMNLSSDYRSFFADKDKQTLLEIFPRAFVSLVGIVHSLVSNMDDCEMTSAKIWLSKLYFLKNEIFDYYKELCGSNIEIPSELEDAFSDLDDEIYRLDIDVNHWSKQTHVKDYLDEIPNLNGVPKLHYWWTEENHEYSKMKYN